MGYSAKDAISRHDFLKNEAGQWLTLWQTLADYVMPRKSEVTDTKTPDIIAYTDRLYDNEALHANNVLAAGQLDYMVSGKWFEFEPPTQEMKNDRDASVWYKKAGEDLLELLNESNFDTVIHEFFYERGGFGTAHLHIDEDEDEVFCFKSCPIGSFFIEENSKGRVNMVSYEFEYTVRQAVEEFGIDKCGKDIQKAYQSGDPKDMNQKFPFIHQVFKRDQRDIDKKDGGNKPWASLYISKKESHICREGGFDEQPFAVSRFLKWGGYKYGYGPSIEAVPYARGSNFIEKQMDAIYELHANPRLLVPDNLEDDVDLRAGGVTIYDSSNPDARPVEWASAADPRSAGERAQQKREAIRRAYLVDLFQLLTNYDEMRREKTAFEVARMLTEKISRINPTFSRIKPEVFKPLLERCLSIAIRTGNISRPPESAMIQKPDGSLSLPAPKVNYTSKLAMAVRASENENFMQFVAMAESLFAMEPTAFRKEFNLGRSIRTLAKNQGVQADMYNTEEEKAAVEEQIQQEQQLALMQMGAGIAKDGAQAASHIEKASPGAISGKR